jgi:hypothetical protein
VSPVPEDDDMRVWLVKLEAKLDVALGTHGARLDAHEVILRDHSSSIQRLSETVAEHTTALRVQAATPSFSWARVLQGAGTAAALLATVVLLLDRLYG